MICSCLSLDLYDPITSQLVIICLVLAHVQYMAEGVSQADKPVSGSGQKDQK